MIILNVINNVYKVLKLPNQIPSAVGFLPKPSHGGFGQFFSHCYLYRNRYKCVDYETCYEKYHKKVHYLPLEVST